MTEARLERASEHVWWFTPDDRTDRPALAAVSGAEATVRRGGGAAPVHTAAVRAPSHRTPCRRSGRPS